MIATDSMELSPLAMKLYSVELNLRMLLKYYPDDERLKIMLDDVKHMIKETRARYAR